MQKNIALFVAMLAAMTAAGATTTQITVQADQVVHPVSRFLTGACIEDVNHEIYGGLYSQMIFGESFQEPPPSVPPKGFKALDGSWSVQDGELRGSAGNGPKLISLGPAFADGEVGVDVFFADRASGNAGLIVRVANAGRGADNFDGYEISLDPSAQILRLGRHRHNWEPIRDTSCPVPVGQWISLKVTLAGKSIEVRVDGRTVSRFEDETAPLPAGAVGLRQWQRAARYRNLWVKIGQAMHSIAFERSQQDELEVSGAWHPMQRGSVNGVCAIEQEHPFVGRQSQRMVFARGRGEFGIQNRGLNREGMYFVGGKPYEGILWARTEKPTELWVALESADGATVHAEKALPLSAGDWQRLKFDLIPKTTEANGRFAIKLKQPGAVTLGYAFLQPGLWGRFKGLPVRRDVAEALIDQGITVLRYGGSMVNHREYRWKKMIGPRDRRPPYHGTWYPHSSNGWGILDFMEFCEAAGFEYIPALNMEETSQDMADFIEYAKGPPDSEWGRKRVADGHPAPFHLHYIELGNEERVDEKYAAKFEALASALWTKDTNIILVVGDFVYGQPIRDPFNFRGAASGITSLVGQQRILRFAQQHQREVWFDLHVGTDGPRPDSTFDGMFSFIDALAKLCDGARYKVVVFEFNAGNHALRRALANALAIQAIERDGRIPIATSANCLQPDGQNDNGWDQGLLFLNPSRVWLQSPGYVTQMFSHNYEPDLVQCDVTGATNQLHVAATRSARGDTLVLQVVNAGEQAQRAEIRLAGFRPTQPTAQVTELSGPIEAVNTVDNSNAIVPEHRRWTYRASEGSASYTFPPHSITVIRFD